MTYNQGGQGAILDHLGCNNLEGIAEEGPEQSHDSAGVQGGEDEGGALLEHGAGGDELDGECDEMKNGNARSLTWPSKSKGTQAQNPQAGRRGGQRTYRQ